MRKTLTKKQRKQKNKFYDFFLGAWEVLHPSEELLRNWHIEFLCEVLEGLAVGKVEKRNLLINIQPRSLKSEIVSVCFPCWRWLHNPEGKWLCLSYASSLANSHNQMRRDLMRSPFYRGLFPELELKDDKNRISEFANNYRGEIISRGFDGSVTGVGANATGGIICLPYHQVINTDSGLLPIGEIVEKKLPIKVATFNHETESIEYGDIERYEENPGRELIEIDLGDRIIECTEDHPVWVKDKGYIPARDIAINDVVLIYDETENL
ncbi:hypothetical protein [Brasilonema sp. UFV-L1]|uniref:hypothetical protein n=1 Tax=Brasilonema sp. UFV-L1 TaxID=2234130 RepID=UPI00145F1D17|nr:hypothetical protein [Brasilonema sp. UFV-L1]